MQLSSLPREKITGLLLGTDGVDCRIEEVRRVRITVWEVSRSNREDRGILNTGGGGFDTRYRGVELQRQSFNHVKLIQISVLIPDSGLG